MTRAEKQIRRDKIRVDYRDGIHPADIAKRYELTEAYVYTVCKGLTSPNNKGYSAILKDNSSEVIELLESGFNKKEIADRFSVSRNAVVQFARDRGLTGKPCKNSEADAAHKIRNKSNGLLEYVSGYTIKENPVRVRCIICGGEFERAFRQITTAGQITCPHCVKRERDQLRKEKADEQERKRAEHKRKAEEREAERERIRIERIHPCPVCGTITDRKKYCSEKCSQKVFNQRGELRRRNLLKSAMIDKDITVDGLYRRDKGICAICGKPCNFEDYVIRDGYKICGDWYPSIDHIIPLAKGGLHSWDNVQLAHRRCNWEKSDSV